MYETLSYGRQSLVYEAWVFKLLVYETLVLTALANWTIDNFKKWRQTLSRLSVEFITKFLPAPADLTIDKFKNEDGLSPTSQLFFLHNYWRTPILDKNLENLPAKL